MIQQDKVTTWVDELKKKGQRMMNWTAPGHDMIHAYWLKKFTSLHGPMARQLGQLLEDGDHPEWLTRGCTVSIMKDQSKGAVPSNYLPITCLPTMWKLFSDVLADKI